MEICQDGSVIMQTSLASSSSTLHKSTVPATTHRHCCATPHKRRSIAMFSHLTNTRHHWIDSLVRSLCNGRFAILSLALHHSSSQGTQETQEAGHRQQTKSTLLTNTADSSTCTDSPINLFLIRSVHCLSLSACSEPCGETLQQLKPSSLY